MPVSEQTYRQIALEDPNGQWELHCGGLRQKPAMTVDHNHLMARLFGRLFQQLDEEEYSVRSNSGRVRHVGPNYYIPDVFVVPTALVRAGRGRSDVLEFYDARLPLVIEVWSPSTGDYDQDTKLPEYQRRGDQEIWRVHPYEQTVTVWRRQPDGTHTESLHRGGSLQPVALPRVTIDLDSLFA